MPGSPDPEEALGYRRPEFTAGFTARSWKCPLYTVTNNYPLRIQPALRLWTIPDHCSQIKSLGFCLQFPRAEKSYVFTTL